MAVSTVKLNGTTLMTVNDTTAAQADVNSSKYFYSADGVKRQGSATPSTPTLITKSITANGTYNASSDNADGYSSVTVNVSGGASNVVTGTFTGTTTGAAMDVNIPYTGTGYPIAVIVYPSDGIRGDTVFFNLVQRYACAMYFASKMDTTSQPTYQDTDTRDAYCIVNRYKNNATTANSYTQIGSNDTRIATQEAASANTTYLVRILSATKLSVFIASTSYGFAANIEYTYVVQYSS